MSISRLQLSDIKIWRLDGTSNFTVKSGYNFLLHGNVSTLQSIAPPTTKHFFNTLWALQLPQKSIFIYGKFTKISCLLMQT